MAARSEIETLLSKSGSGQGRKIIDDPSNNEHRSLDSNLIEAQKSEMHGTRLSQATRLEYLDSLRGLAAMAVIIFHYCQAYGPVNTRWHSFNISFLAMTDGLAAVSLFFVLSGFVLSLRFWRSRPKLPMEGFHYLPYTVTRVCRLCIPFLVAYAIVAVIPRHIFERIDTFPRPRPWLRFLYESWPHTFRFYIADSSLFRLGASALIPQGWTLSVELILSMLVPVGVLIGTARTAWLMGTCAVLVYCMHTSPFIFHFCLGIVIAKEFERIQAYLREHRIVSIALGVTSIVLYTFRSTVVPASVEWQTWWVWWITGAGAGCLIVVVSTSHLLKRCLMHPTLVGLGKLSYSTYLIHMQILACVTPMILTATHRVDLTTAWLIGLSFTIVATCICSIPFYFLVEKNSIALGKTLARRLESGIKRRHVPSE
jgi:peptidoglycan/LPS O-acetylase OafA/YrhL